MAATSIGNSGLTPTALVVGAASPITYVSNSIPGSYVFLAYVNNIVDGDKYVCTVNLKVVPGGDFGLYNTYPVIGAQNAKVWSWPEGAIWAPNGIEVFGSLPVGGGNRIVRWELGRVDS